jgi:hypothetical protein
VHLAVGCTREQTRVAVERPVDDTRWRSGGGELAGELRAFMAAT